MTPKRKSNTITLVYLGSIRDAKGGGEHRRFRLVTKEQAAAGTPAPDINEERWYRAKGFKKGMTAGAMYEVTEHEAEDGSKAISMSTFRPLGLWPNREDRAAWQEEERSQKADDEAMKRIKNDDALFESLSAARRIYSAAGPRRHIVLARIVQLVTKP